MKLIRILMEFWFFEILHLALKIGTSKDSIDYRKWETIKLISRLQCLIAHDYYEELLFHYSVKTNVNFSNIPLL